KSEKKIVTLVQRAEIKTLDPQKATDSISLGVIHYINEKLVSIGENGEIILEIADKIQKINEKITDIKIKKDLYFSDGEALTVDDVVFSLERARLSPSGARDFFMFEKFEKVDEDTLRIHSFYEAGNMFHKLASTRASIISKKAFEENEENIIGSGMFKLVERIPGDKIILERNSYYKKSSSNIDKLVIRVVPEANSRAIMLETGEIDISTNLLPLDFKRISEIEKLEAMEIETPSNMFLGFDLKNSLLSDIRVRKAIAYAINKQDLVDVVFHGSATPAVSPVPKNTTGHNEKGKSYNQNIEKAKELLKEAGYPDGFDIELFVNEDNQRVDMAVIIQDNLKAIGINAEIKIFQWATYISMIENQDFIKPLFLLSWNISNDDPEEVLYPLYHSSQIDTHTNVVSYKNQKFDALIMKARFSTNKNERIELYKEAQNIIQEDLPHYTLLYPKQNFAHKANIKNINYNKRGFFDFTKTIIE
ncbi:MAG: ABC transporter substrate-binding protein, partial [Fusobacterium sp.]|nr:ABC transporter substrate-binding protein [Fusobacterium sp.]